MSINPDSPYEQMKKERKRIPDATMPPPTEKPKIGYRTKHSVITTLPMHLGTLERVKKRRRRFGDISDDDVEDLSNAMGYTPQSISMVGSRDFQTQT